MVDTLVEIGQGNVLFIQRSPVIVVDFLCYMGYLYKTLLPLVLLLMKSTCAMTIQVRME